MLAESQSEGLHQLRQLVGLQHIQPLTTATSPKLRVRSEVIDKCCSVKANLLCKTCPGLSPASEVNIFFSSFFFFFFFSFTQRTINACPFITAQKTKNEVIVIGSHSTQAFTWIHKSLKSDPVLPPELLFCCDVLFSYLL